MKRYLKLIISLSYLIVAFIIDLIKLLFHIQISPRFLILYYHSVPDSKIENFRWQLNILKKKGLIVSADHIPESNLSKRYYAITFDDGFLSVINNALPELSKNNMVSTIFIPTGYINQSPSWQIKGEIFDNEEKIINIEQLKDIDKKLVKIGSHSISHPDFTTLNDAEQKEQFIVSKKFLEELTGDPISTFSFPYGAYNYKAMANAINAGYRIIFNSEPAYVKLKSKYNNNLRGRIPISTEETKLEFLVKINGGYNWISSYIHFKQELKYYIKRKASGKTFH